MSVNIDIRGEGVRLIARKVWWVFIYLSPVLVSLVLLLLALLLVRYEYYISIISMISTIISSITTSAVLTLDVIWLVVVLQYYE